MTDTQTNSIPVTIAAVKAINFVNQLYQGKKIKDILVEEVEFSELTNQWLITIGFTINKVKDDSSSLILPERESTRKYKIVHIDAQSGKAISMKIREI